MVLDHLLADMDPGERALVGIDCAFSLPFARAGVYFSGPATAFDLWGLIDRICADEPDAGASAFVSHPSFANGFWRSGRLADGERLPQRATERACRDGGLGTPESPYKLIGPKQVGKGALTGMRLLHAIRSSASDRFAIWPFDRDLRDRHVLVEIYPRLFLRLARAGMGKLRRWDELDRVLGVLGSAPIADRGQEPPSDHETDALLSAAGLRMLAARPRIWAPDGLDETARSQEGWIFGVGAGLDEASRHAVAAMGGGHGRSSHRRNLMANHHP